MIKSIRNPGGLISKENDIPNMGNAIFFLEKPNVICKKLRKFVNIPDRPTFYALSCLLVIPPC